MTTDDNLETEIQVTWADTIILSNFMFFMRQLLKTKQSDNKVNLSYFAEDVEPRFVSMRHVLYTALCAGDTFDVNNAVEKWPAWYHLWYKYVQHNGVKRVDELHDALRIEEARSNLLRDFDVATPKAMRMLRGLIKESQKDEAMTDDMQQAFAVFAWPGVTDNEFFDV